MKRHSPVVLLVCFGLAWGSQARAQDPAQAVAASQARVAAQETTQRALGQWSDPVAAAPTDPPVGEAQPVEEAQPAEEAQPVEEEVVLPPDHDVEVVAPLHNLGTVGGGVSKVDEEDLKALRYDDPHSALTQVPGLTVRQEDAFGLRPNIGLRGANSDRSKKLTLMEDGILFGPAPYSAPAAYYFPMMARITGVEVFKGPGAVLYGPNTVSGALNLKSRPIPVRPEGGVDASYGQFGTLQTRGNLGGSGDWWGVVFDGVRIETDGFKELDGGGGTGFVKDEFTLKARVNTPDDVDTYQALEIKLTYSSETSNETYLGLSEADFKANPNRRYRASALDEMVNDRLAGQAEYVLEWDRDLDFTITAYRHDFSRVWTRLNGFERGPDLYTLLSNPDEGQNRVFFDVLTGAADSSSTAEALRITANDREFVSQGVQALARHRHKGEGWTNSAEFGVRVHADEIERDHTERRYSMQAGALVADGSDPIPTTRNRGSAQALSFHFIDQIGLGAFTFAPGVRAELIQTELLDRLDGQTFENGQNVLLPGAGLHWALTNEFGFLGGVHRGFSPVPPQRAASSAEAEEVEPETSLNYEAGARYYDAQEGTLLELVGFLNDYQNLTGLCSFSSGCPEEQLDQQFNAGEATVYGVELAADHNFGGEDLRLPVRLAYTFTRSRFDTSFASDDPQFGDVSEGDALPYVPEHQGSLRLGVEQAGEWSFHAAGTYVSPMLESAGLFDDPDALITDAQAFVDLKAEVHLFDGFTVYSKLDNALDARPIAARRPFGARPIRPFLAQIGTRFDF